MNRTTIVLDAALREKARALNLNISDICRNALRMELIRHRQRPSIAGWVR